MARFSPSELLDYLCSDVGATRSAPSAVVLVAHPDDEVIGCGSRLSRLPAVTIVHVTDGAPRSMHDAVKAGFDTWQAYAEARRHELYDALSLVGIGPDRARTFGYPDQGATLALADITRDIAGLLRELKPDMVITHPYEGGQPDHDATAFAVHMACRLVAHEGTAAPAIVEMTSYHDRGGEVESGVFLPCAHCEERWVVLSEEERALKLRMFECYRTQSHVLKWFPVGIERFRIAPEYDFARPPHDGVLFYERFDWGMTGSRWRELAGEALSALGLSTQRGSGDEREAMGGPRPPVIAGG